MHDLKLTDVDEKKKNAMGAYEPFSLYFIVVPSEAHFFINVVLIN